LIASLKKDGIINKKASCATPCHAGLETGFFLIKDYFTDLNAVSTAS